MRKLRRLGVAVLALGLSTVSVPVSSDADPVVAARVQRAAALGIAEDDLPPVPRGIIEPPPLPPPEIHPKDLRSRKGARKAGSTVSKKSGSGKKGTAAKKGTPAKKGSKKASQAKGK